MLFFDHANKMHDKDFEDLGIDTYEMAKCRNDAMMMFPSQRDGKASQ